VRNWRNCGNRAVRANTRPRTVERLLSALEAGLTLKQACVAAGIGETTLHERRKEYSDLEPRLEAARERAREAALRAIRAAGEKDWPAHEAWLRLSFQNDYRGCKTRVVQEGALTKREK